MTTIRNTDPSAAVPAIAAARLNGRVDALDGNRLHGWLWDEVRPEERLKVRLLLDGRRIMEVDADQGRIDLRRNGIGDGRHAFSMELDEATAAARDRLGVVGISPSTGAELELRLPPPAELAAEAAIAVPLARFFDRVEALIALNRRMQIEQKELGTRLDQVAERLGKDPATGDTAPAGQDEIVQRIAELDVFQMRFDETLRGFDTRLIALRKEAQKPLREVTVILGFLTGLSVLLSLSTLALLLTGR